MTHDLTALTQPLPLVRYQVLRTDDADEACTQISDRIAPHELSIVRDAARFGVRLHTAPLQSWALSYLDYGHGARVLVSWPHIDGFYQLRIPLAGAVETINSRERVVATPSMATMAQPDESLHLDVQPGAPLMLVRFDAAALERSLWRMLGEEPTGRLRFNLGQDLTTPQLRGWLDLVRLVSGELDQGRSLTTHPLAVRHLRHLVTTGLLLGARHNLSERLHEADGRGVMPRHVRQAVDYMYGHARSSITVEEVAAAVGVGARALQHAFRRHLDTTPGAYLRSIRLREVYEELQATPPGSGVTVTEVATRWGFLHLGDFARAYGQEFGEKPSVTLRRR
ncbi:hypothetical protein GCM10009609_65380 [Pseudonocardia aurantiaca]|uniref:AraC family transcriptional regulator n=1 Tax=Pseudonocardia aurantiaca TaxID=75290 RepID=A0ABW4FTD9_9PSEU